jgi:hypothetical protein
VANPWQRRRPLRRVHHRDTEEAKKNVFTTENTEGTEKQKVKEKNKEEKRKNQKEKPSVISVTSVAKKNFFSLCLCVSVVNSG